MTTHTKSFDFRPDASQAPSEARETYFSVVSERIFLRVNLSARRKADGYWDIWFDVATINDSPIVPRLGSREVQVSNAVAMFAQVVALPTANRYIIHDVVDSPDALETACTILLAVETLLRAPQPRTRSSERIEVADRDRELKSKGVAFEASRTPDQQRRVIAAFERLKAAGYRAYEVGPTQFALSREIVGGGSSFQGEEESIEALESAAERADRRKSGWRAWL